MRTTLRIATGLALAVALGACATTMASPDMARDDGWIETWATAVQPPTPPGGRFPGSPSFSDVTIRQVVRISAGGDAVRVRFTNEYGEAPLLVGAARVALADDAGAITPGSEHMLTFAGRPSATIPPGAPLVSDPVAMSVGDLAKLSISVYLPEDSGPCTCHQVGLETGYVSASGDHTSGMFESAEEIQSRAFLSGVDIMPEGPGKTVVAFGDSITDGVGSTSGANQRWPDLLAERLLAKGDGVAWGMANVGISGNQVLSPGAGEAALARFDRDVLGRPGVDYVIVFEGVNDIGIAFGASGFGPARNHPLTAADMITGYEQMIERAHLAGIKIIGATVAPYEGASYWAPEGEAVREDINTWIRTSGAFDGVLDFDEAFRDPGHPTQIADGLHAGDHLHGNDAGYRKVADSIDLSLFQ